MIYGNPRWTGSASSHFPHFANPLEPHTPSHTCEAQTCGPLSAESGGGWRRFTVGRSLLPHVLHVRIYEFTNLRIYAIISPRLSEATRHRSRCGAALPVPSRACLRRPRGRLRRALPCENHRRSAVCTPMPTTTGDASQLEVEPGATCRFCFEGEGELIVPCKCSGSQKYVHRECLCTWLQHAHGSSLSNTVECRVCQQPFKLRVPGLGHYLSQALRSLFSGRGIRSACAVLGDDLDHLLNEPHCAHVHCAWLRLGVAAGLLQLCIWEGQLLLVMLFVRHSRYTRYIAGTALHLGGPAAAGRALRTLQPSHPLHRRHIAVTSPFRGFYLPGPDSECYVTLHDRYMNVTWPLPDRYLAETSVPLTARSCSSHAPPLVLMA